MNPNIFYSFASVTLISSISLLSVIGLGMTREQLQSILPVLVSLAVGALYGDALLHLVPESFANCPTPMFASLAILAGVFGSLLFEYGVMRKHGHLPRVEPYGERFFDLHPTAMINLFSSATHNFVDGILIGTAYLTSFRVGVATTIAVLLHEIPHELGDFGILVHSGMAVRRAILFNCLSATVSFVGLALTLLVGERLQLFPEVALPFTCGAFLYLAGTKLMPEVLIAQTPVIERWKWAALIGGLALMALLKLV